MKPTAPVVKLIARLSASVKMLIDLPSTIQSKSGNTPQSTLYSINQVDNVSRRASVSVIVGLRSATYECEQHARFDC